MRICSHRAISVAMAVAMPLASVVAQLSQPGTKGARAAREASAFWTDTAALEVTLRVNVKAIRGDRADRAPWRPATVVATTVAGDQELPARVRTRGISRRQICDVPPLAVDLPEKRTKQTVFAGVERLKLVIPCKRAGQYERYVLQELSLYRVVALFTPAAHLTRLIRLSLVDSASGKVAFTQWAFVVEDGDELAKRLGGKRLTVTGAVSEDLDPYQTALVGVLSYLIGSTDFSISGLHNAELVQIDRRVLPVIYDFDQAGVIAPPYAVPSPKLAIRSVRDRLYRGLCVPRDTLLRVLAEVRTKRADIEGIYAGALSHHIGTRTVNEMKQYFADFFRIIDDPRRVKREIEDACSDSR